MARLEKETIVKELKDKFKKAKGAILSDYRGLNVQELANLRRDLREQGVEYKVYKNTLIRIATETDAFKEIHAYLTGPTAVAFSYDDPIFTAKLLASFAKKHKALALKGGIIEGRVIDAKAVQLLVSLPSREELLAKMVGLLKSPVSSLVNVLNSPLQGLAVALKKIAAQKE